MPDPPLRLLGPLDLVGPTGRFTSRGRQRRLLAVPALRAGSVVEVDELVVWAGAPPRTAVKALQNYVLRLRRAIAPCAGIAVRTRSPATDSTPRTAASRPWVGLAPVEFAGEPFAQAAAARLAELPQTAREDLIAVRRAPATTTSASPSWRRWSR